MRWEAVKVGFECRRLRLLPFVCEVGNQFQAAVDQERSRMTDWSRTPPEPAHGPAHRGAGGGGEGQESRAVRVARWNGCGGAVLVLSPKCIKIVTPRLTLREIIPRNLESGVTRTVL
jgi:hypothetical protein